MIIDSHAHVIPDMRGASGYPDAETHMAAQQATLSAFWGRMVTSTPDPRFAPLPGEKDIDFKAGRFGRYTWKKHGEECWLQRFPLIFDKMEWSPEQMIAYMDSESVDMAVLQTGYMEDNFCREYYSDCVRKWPNRFIPTVTIDYDMTKSAEYRAAELRKVEHSVADMGTRALYGCLPKGQPFNHEAFDPFWRKLSDLSLPLQLVTGFTTREDYLQSLEEIRDVVERFPDVQFVFPHLGGNVFPPSSENYTNSPEDLLPLLKKKNVWFEVGYVLAYENRDLWGAAYEYPYPEHERLIKRVYDEVGAERLLWGSDMPHLYRTCTYRQSLDLVRLHMDFLSASEKAAVLGDNAARLYRVG